MSKPYCINCWYSPIRRNAKTCPSCGYPDEKLMEEITEQEKEWNQFMEDK